MSKSRSKCLNIRCVYDATFADTFKLTMDLLFIIYNREMSTGSGRSVSSMPFVPVASRKSSASTKPRRPSSMERLSKRRNLKPRPSILALLTESLNSMPTGSQSTTVRHMGCTLATAYCSTTKALGEEGHSLQGRSQGLWRTSV